MAESPWSSRHGVSVSLKRTSPLLQEDSHSLDGAFVKLLFHGSCGATALRLELAEVLTEALGQHASGLLGIETWRQALGVIATGFENSGTTALSRLLMSAPALFGSGPGRRRGKSPRNRVQRIAKAATNLEGREVVLMST